MDLYALGAALLQCFYRPPKSERGSEVLFRSANATLWDELESTLPFWLQDLPSTRDAMATLRKLVDPVTEVRGSLTLPEIALELNKCHYRMQPAIAVQELLGKGEPERAYTFLQNVLLFLQSADLLLEAAKVALSCDRPLEAVEHCETAIAINPERLEAYRRQFEILVSEEARRGLLPLMYRQADAGHYLDKRIYRDFEKIAFAHDTAEVQMGGHMLWRGQIEDALSFIYKRLQLTNGRPSGAARLSLWLLYVEAWLARGSGAEARRELTNVRYELNAAASRASIEPDELERLSGRWRELDGRLTEAGYFAIA
jgi:hypothetical protein